MVPFHHENTASNSGFITFTLILHTSCTSHHVIYIELWLLCQIKYKIKHYLELSFVGMSLDGYQLTHCNTVYYPFISLIKTWCLFFYWSVYHLVLFRISLMIDPWAGVLLVDFWNILQVRPWLVNCTYNIKVCHFLKNRKNYRICNRQKIK